MQNWSGTVEFTAPHHAEPATSEELQGLVRAGGRVRAIGTGHSFTAIADTTGTLVSTARFDPDLRLDEERRVVSLSSGTRYAAVATFLTEHGWALHNMGSLPHISVAGAIATGTHGSGDLNGSLSTAVRGLQLVGADGALRWVRHGDPEFPGSVVALGLLGVVTRVELAVEPGYRVRQDAYTGITWDALLHDVGAISGAGYSVSVFTHWTDDEVVGPVFVKRRVETAGEPVPETLLDGRRDPSGTARIVESADDNQTQQGVEGAWSDHLPHFRIDSTPSAGNEIQSEYFIDRADAPAALRALHAVRHEIAPLLIVGELRTIAADDLWLSPAYRRESMALHFTWHPRPDEALAACARIEAALEPFAPRPHWGKVHAMPGGVVAGRYPRMADFRALVVRRDPDGVFAAPALEAVLGGVLA